ncbi:MAG: hypothetical protein ACXVC3_19995, partial [Bdellovibrio sp.]
MKKLALIFAVFLFGGCGKPSAEDQRVASNGKANVSFSGDIYRSTVYGEAPNTAVYCTRYLDEIRLIFQENGQNKKNDSWLLDGVMIFFFHALRPQDVSSLGVLDTDIYAAVKEIKDQRSTFRLPQGEKCTIKVNSDGDKLSGYFKCDKLENRYFDEKINAEV